MNRQDNTWNHTLMIVCMVTLSCALIACGADDEGSADTSSGSSSGADASSSSSSGVDTSSSSSSGVDTTSSGADAQGGCQSSGDCGAGDRCEGPDEPTTCGIPSREECASQMDCPMDSVCHAIPDACSADGVGSECRSSCDSDGECGEGFTCSADGACEAITCDSGFTCLATQRCEPPTSDVVHERSHGCVFITCDGSTPCASGVCVNGVCQSSAGMCILDQPVP